MKMWRWRWWWWIMEQNNWLCRCVCDLGKWREGWFLISCAVGSWIIGPWRISVVVLQGDPFVGWNDDMCRLVSSIERRCASSRYNQDLSMKFVFFTQHVFWINDDGFTGWLQSRASESRNSKRHWHGGCMYVCDWERGCREERWKKRNTFYRTHALVLLAVFLTLIWTHNWCTDSMKPRHPTLAFSLFLFRNRMFQLANQWRSSPLCS